MKKKILLIAGHGEGDPGAVSKWGQEADLARDLLKRIPKYLNVSVLNAELYDTAKDCYQQTKKGTGPDYGAYDFILEIHFNAKQKMGCLSSPAALTAASATSPNTRCS